MTVNFVVDGVAAAGARTVTVTTAGGTSGGQTFTVTLPAPGAPTLTQRRAECRRRGQHGGGDADGHQLRCRRDDGGRQRGQRDGHHRHRDQPDILDGPFCDRRGRRPRRPERHRHDRRRDQRCATLHGQSTAANADERHAESGCPGATVPVTLTGTNFVVGATGGRQRGGVTVTSVVAGQPTSLTANVVVDAAAATGARTATVTTAGGTSGGQTFTITLPAPGAPTLTSVAPNSGVRGSYGGGHADGHQFRRRRPTVAVSGTGVTATPST